MRTIKVDSFEIGDRKTYIIAEAGLNHDGDLKQAKKLIKKAAEIGADAVKFQIFKAEELYDSNSDSFDIFKSLEFRKREWEKLHQTALKNQITFLASVFGPESADLLQEMGVSSYKIASGDLNNLPLLEYIAGKNLPIILSTGMSNIGEIDEALNTIYKKGNYKVALLHCVSDYPTKYDEINLKVISTLKEIFKLPVGLSDHTLGTFIPPLAVSLGANIIEKHFTLDKNRSGNDHKISLNAHEFKEMVNSIRKVEAALGDGIKRLTLTEEANIHLARKSITAKTDIKRGEEITMHKIKIVRPGLGIEPKYIDMVIGKKARKDILKSHPLRWNDI